MGDAPVGHVLAGSGRGAAGPLDRWLAGAAVVVDPFARDATRGTLRNDLNPATAAEFHMDARDFCRHLAARGVVADAALMDPPYSPRQIKEVYESVGRTVTREDTQHAGLVAAVKDGLAPLLRPGGIAVTCGWNSTGFGRGRGFDLVELLIVCHGGSHNDTIVTVERKAA